MDKETVPLNESHRPAENAIQAFEQVDTKIKEAVIASRKHWDAHEPEMWKRAKGLSDSELTSFKVSKDLVLVRSGPTPYGTVIFGKIKIPALNDAYIHVRIHDPPNRGTDDVVFHSLLTDEGNRDADGRPTTWDAIFDEQKELDFFNE
ncbi:hypothetical protein BT69DRAFT_1311218 [Atractiella rhizophila]|nr:hypothetical protein BT69DRAFT_1311218 [Atractiella rhizophila]